MVYESNTEVILKAADYGAIGLAVSTLVGWMPGVAAVLSVVWLALRILTQREEFRIRRLERKKLEEDA
jgi:hypothetical protein